MARAAGHSAHAPSLRRLLGTWSGLTAVLGLFVFAGAVSPLLLAADGILDDADRSKLRILALPIYAASLAILAARPGRLAWALACNWPLVLLTALPFLSTLWSVSGSITLRRAIALAMSMSLTFVLATRFTPREQLRILALVLGSCTVASILFAGLAPGLAFMPGESALRGIFMHKNVLGWVSSFTVVIALASLNDPARGLRRAGWALLAIGLLGTLLSTSVTSLLASVLAIFLARAAAMIACRRGLSRLVLELVLISTTAIVLLGLAVALIPLLETLGKDATLTGRVPLWSLVDPIIAARPMTGYGFGAFWTDANTDAWLIWESIGWKAPHAHNGYRDLMLGLGLIGALVFALTVLRAIGQAFVLYTADPEEGTLWCILIIGVSLMLNLSESTFLMQNDLMWLLMTSAIVTVAIRRTELDRARSVPVPPALQAV